MLRPHSFTPTAGTAKHIRRVEGLHFYLFHKMQQKRIDRVRHAIVSV